MDESTSAVRLPGAAARRFGHVCGFFHSRDEEYRVLLPLTKEGFERGEKVFHIVDPENRSERMRRLEEVGISSAAARRPDQVDIRAWEDSYLRGGRFDQDAMMTLLEETLRGAKADGFGQTRVWANMEWCWKNSRGWRISWSMKPGSITSYPRTTTLSSARTTSANSAPAS